MSAIAAASQRTLGRLLPPWWLFLVVGISWMIVALIVLRFDYTSVNAIAIRDRYEGLAVCVDFGTATTYDIVSHDGEYLGGALMTGIEISLEAQSLSASVSNSVVDTDLAHPLYASAYTLRQNACFISAALRQNERELLAAEPCGRRPIAYFLTQHVRE